MKDKAPDYEHVQIFREIYKDLESVYDQFPKLCGLSGTEFWALTMIQEGISTQYGICEHLSISRQTVNSAFRNLKRRGLIHLEAMDSNLRVKQVYLTEAGQEFVNKEICRMHDLEENVWRAMEEGERVQITRLLSKYKDLLTEAIQNYKN